MHGLAARGPDHHHHSARKKTYRLKALFAVIDPCVLNSEYRTRQHDLRVKEIESPVIQIFPRLTGSNVISTGQLLHIQ